MVVNYKFFCGILLIWLSSKRKTQLHCIFIEEKGLQKNQRYKIENGTLHWRDLGLGQPELISLLKGLSTVLEGKTEKLTSFSLSYNNELGDAGVIELLKVLPPSIKDVGLVGCNIGDAGGERVLEWMARTTDLNMLCIEGNNLSKEMKARFVERSEEMNFQFFG